MHIGPIGDNLAIDKRSFICKVVMWIFKKRIMTVSNFSTFFQVPSKLQGYS